MINGSLANQISLKNKNDEYHNKSIKVHDKWITGSMGSSLDCCTVKKQLQFHQQITHKTSFSSYGKSPIMAEKKENELELLRNQIKSLQATITSLQQQKSSDTKNQRHSVEFWEDIQVKLKNNTEAVKLLIKDGTITMNAIDIDGNLLLHLAAFWGNYEITQLCINLGADLKYKNNKDETAMDRATDGKCRHTEQLLLFSEMDAEIGQRIRGISQNINK